MEQYLTADDARPDLLSQSVGQRLRAARELRGLSYRELAAVTKIQQHLLAYLEEDRFSEFPAEVFARGFLRNYARELGLDEREIVDLYLAQTGINENPVRQSLETAEVTTVRTPFSRFPDTTRLGPWAYAAALSLFLIGLAVTVLAFGGQDTASSASFQPSSASDAWKPSNGGQLDWTVRQN